MNESNSMVQNLALSSWVWIRSGNHRANPETGHQVNQRMHQTDLLSPIRRWLDQVQVKNPQLAHRICQLVPAQCPFERDIVLFGRQLAHIPPLCKLNPLYEEVVGLRFRALCYLADECGEDITQYC
ncbi:MAG: Mo-dependent nitrogenase C-terminal domain-containing protein [Thainema sp.]